MLDYHALGLLRAAKRSQEMGDKMKAAGLSDFKPVTEEGKQCAEALRAIYEDGQNGVMFTRVHCLLVDFMYQNFDVMLAKEVEAQKAQGIPTTPKNPGKEEDPSLH